MATLPRRNPIRTTYPECRIATPRPYTPPPTAEARTAEPGRCRLTLTIDGTDYAVRPVPREPGCGAVQLWRLTKADGTRHDVAELEEEPNWTRHPDYHGFTCTCPDFAYRRDGIDPAGCKHVKALRAVGVLVRRNPTPAADPTLDTPVG